jgi:predicted ribosomally synthesized peptide with SipW-like signal peptide
MKKGKVLATFGAVALIGAIGVGSTFAYLTDKTGTVTNTFTVGNVTFDEDFNGGLSESYVVRQGTTFDADGNVVTEGTGAYTYDADGDDNWTVSENNYTNLYPGETVAKDPTVKLSADSLDAWVYAQVTYNADQFTINLTEDWVQVSTTTENGQTVAVLAKTDKLAAGTTSTIFDEVTLSEDIKPGAEVDSIIVKACAVQDFGFDDYTGAIDEGAVAFAE